MFTRNLKKFLPFGARGIATWQTPQLKAKAKQLALRNPHFAQDLKMLEDSAHDYRIEQHDGRGSYDHTQRRVRVGTSTAGLPGREEESFMHEVHHGSQHEAHSRSFPQDVVSQIWESPTHRRAMELSALSTGKGSTRTPRARQEVLDHWQKYDDEPGYGSAQEARRLLKSKFHTHSWSRLIATDFRPEDLFK